MGNQRNQYFEVMEEKAKQAKMAATVGPHSYPHLTHGPAVWSQWDEQRRQQKKRMDMFARQCYRHPGIWGY